PMAPDSIHVDPAAGPKDASLLVSLREYKLCSYQQPHEFFMLRSMMGTTLEAAFQSWFEKYPGIAEPSQLALSVLNALEVWSHVEFLSLMQSLEGLHRA